MADGYFEEMSCRIDISLTWAKISSKMKLFGEVETGSDLKLPVEKYQNHLPQNISAITGDKRLSRNIRTNRIISHNFERNRETFLAKN